MYRSFDAVTLHFLRFIYCISYDAHNKQLLFSCTTVTGLPTVSHYVLCEVRTEVRVMPQAASRRPFTEEARVRSQFVYVRFAVDIVALRQVFLQVRRVSLA
jgi:hypothetical protein